MRIYTSFMFARTLHYLEENRGRGTGFDEKAKHSSRERKGTGQGKGKCLLARSHVCLCTSEQ